MLRHLHIQARFLTKVDTDILIEVAHGSAFRRQSELLFRAMILIELAYRVGIRALWVPSAVWNFVFTGQAPPPPGLCSPSEAGDEALTAATRPSPPKKPDTATSLQLPLTPPTA